MNAPLLGLRDVCVQRHGQGDFLVRDLTLELRRGETTCLLGESGSGKSLTALAVMRLLPGGVYYAGGDIHYRGVSLPALPEWHMRQYRGGKIGMIFQDPQSALNPVRTVGAQIGEAVRLHGGLHGAAAQRRVIELLAAVGLPQPAQRIDFYPHQLSGGMKQRVMIAAALAGEPELLIADEPTTALDVTVQAQLLDLLREIQGKRQMAMLFITHDLAVAARIADTVVENLSVIKHQPKCF